MFLLDFLLIYLLQYVFLSRLLFSCLLFLPHLPRSFIGSTPHTTTPVPSIKSAMVGSVYEVRADWGVPGIVRRKTDVSRKEGRRRGWSGTRHSRSRATPQQPLEQTSRAEPFRQPSQSQHHGRKIGHPSLHLASPHGDGHAGENGYDGEDDELPESPCISAPEGSRGRHGDATIAAPISHPEGPAVKESHYTLDRRIRLLPVPVTLTHLARNLIFSHLAIQPRQLRILTLHLSRMLAAET